VLRIALDLGRHAILNGDQEGAGVGAIVGAGGTDLCGCHQAGFRRKNFVKPILYPIPDRFVRALDYIG
jgi:hypothetical protein